jgi:predicted nucleic acid-binding protein
MNWLKKGNLSPLNQCHRSKEFFLLKRRINFRNMLKNQEKNGIGIFNRHDVVIDYLGNKLPLSGSSFIDNLPGVISVISRIEILGWYNATPEQLAKLRTFIQSSVIYSLTEHYVQKAILLRQQHKIKLPDAIIAATAIAEGLTLVTRNSLDFKNIETLELLNPWEL